MREAADANRFRRSRATGPVATVPRPPLLIPSSCQHAQQQTTARSRSYGGTRSSSPPRCLCPAASPVRPALLPVNYRHSADYNGNDHDLTFYTSFFFFSLIASVEQYHAAIAHHNALCYTTVAAAGASVQALICDAVWRAGYWQLCQLQDSRNQQRAQCMWLSLY